MTKPRRVSISTLCVVVAVVAIDFAWLRHVTIGGHKSLLGFRGPALDAGAMPMANLLSVGLAYLLSNRGRTPRWCVGFLSGGLAGLVLYLAYNWTCLVLPPDLVHQSMEPIYWARRKWSRLGSLSYYLYYADAIYYGTPQILLATMTGWISRKEKSDGIGALEAPAGLHPGDVDP